jgi:hypothetical protein
MSSYRSRSSLRVVTFLAAISLGILQASAQNQPDTPPATPLQEQPEVLSRGPVHEAFAEPVAIQTQGSLIVPVQPPANIQEVPPAERPQGSQFVWIPGYWSWDADRLGYIWVSACWRAAPPKMSWVPGYWSQVPGGWEWISGFWSPSGAQNIQYLPAPPVIEDLEPVTVQPSPDMIWVPPCMYWYNGHYVRRAGYWLTAQSSWVWVPAHYVVTPRGYVFADGHWDYSLDRRGVLFAPVYFSGSAHLRAGYTFSPGIVVDLGLLSVSLFTYPRYNHYYFGDYYDRAYLSIGIFPWFECRRHHTWYDPIYEHDRWQHRAVAHWEDHKRDEYLRRFNDRTLRPAHTFHEQEARLARLPESQRHASQTVKSLDVSISSRKTSIKFEQISTDTRQKISKQADAVRTYRDERTRWETPSSDRKTAQPSETHKPSSKPSTQHRQTVQPVEEHKPTLTQPTEQKQTIQPSETRKPSSKPSTGHRNTIQPSEEHKPTLPQPSEQKQTVQQSETRKPASKPSTGHRKTIQPSEEHKPTLTQPSEQKQTVQPIKEYEPALTQPSEHRQAGHSPERSGSPAAEPVSPQISAPSPARETRSFRSERVQVPASPVVGNSGRSGFFRKGPPAQPNDETKKRSAE